MSDSINSNVPTKDQNLDKVFWFKFVVSIIVGVSFGVLNITGFMSFILYFLGSTIISFFYFKKFVNTDEDVEYQSEVFIEGLNVSVPVFLLVWILSNTINRMNVISAEAASTLV